MEKAKKPTLGRRFLNYYKKHPYMVYGVMALGGGALGAGAGYLTGLDAESLGALTMWSAWPGLAGLGFTGLCDGKPYAED